MRNLVQPPPSSRCNLCGGELRLKQIKSADHDFTLDSETVICVTCGREQTCTVSHDRNTPKAA